MSALTTNSNQANSQANFVTTHWSAVLAVGLSSSTVSEQALSWLCRTYWYPLHAFARRQGRSSHDAEDLTQAFFAQ